MTPNNNDKDTPMEHGELPDTTENAQVRPVMDNAVPSPNTTAAVRPAVGTSNSANSGQNTPVIRGSTFHGAMGFSRGLGRGGRGRAILNVRGRGGRGNSGPGRGNFGHDRGGGQSSRGRGFNSNFRGGIRKAPPMARPSNVSKSTDKPNNEVVPLTSQSIRNQATGKEIPMACVLDLSNEGDVKKFREMEEYARANNYLFMHGPMIDNSNEIARRRNLVRQIDHDAPVSRGLTLSREAMTAKRPRPPVGRSDEPRDEPCMKCIVCKSRTHTIEYCLESPIGTLPACILCPSLQHHTEDCVKDMSLTERVRLFVDGRANLPPIDVKVPWWDLLYTWLNDESSKGEALPTAFPWSPAFAKEIAHRQRGQYVKGLQTEFDSSGHDREMLPKDLTTSTLDAVYVNHVAKGGTTWVTDLAKRVLGEGSHNG
ncbi:hypothetical protein FPANT_13196 [Fusarium pseudoanthophilum]|uniref:Uncharacterized protein n=1 Tax=Fusarium pseudoanthophilum TaxID=48495 RepID=A0A8H5NNP4_9HYPO|nr:hypothetical protein FPANT_13196 [Fusarium pseudoanthophilum]